MTYRVANGDLRQQMKAAGIPMWMVARKIGVSEQTLSRWLRVTVTPERHKSIETAIAQVAGGEACENC